MTPSHTLRFRCSRTTFVAVALILLGLGTQARAVPLDNNATKQIWKLKYGVSDAQLGSSTWLNQDSDGDGLTNDAEITAGTNPFNAGSALRITSITNGATSVDLTFPTENGKQYVVQ